MFRAAYRSSSGALTVFAASGLHMHVVTGRSQVWVGSCWLFLLSHTTMHGSMNIKNYIATLVWAHGLLRWGGALAVFGRSQTHSLEPFIKSHGKE